MDNCVCLWNKTPLQDVAVTLSEQVDERHSIAPTIALAVILHYTMDGRRETQEDGW